MACSGHTVSTSCAGHTVGPCDGHTGSTGGVATTWTDVPLTTTTKIKAVHHNELRSTINAELVRRSKAWPHDPGTVDTTLKVLSTHVRDLRDAVNNALAWVWPPDLSESETEVGDYIKALQYTALRDRVNFMELACTCNCNYICTCNCNYACTCQCNYSCTCDCNYCACNCNYGCTCDCNVCSCNCNVCSCDCNVCSCDGHYDCTCNCNYGCTCNCNYACTCNCDYGYWDSDRRLKHDIVYM